MMKISEWNLSGGKAVAAWLLYTSFSSLVILPLTFYVHRTETKWGDYESKGEA